MKRDGRAEAVCSASFGGTGRPHRRHVGPVQRLVQIEIAWHLQKCRAALS
jgi:hypothetical protein